MAKKQPTGKKPAYRAAQYAWPTAQADLSQYNARHRFLALLIEECPEAWNQLLIAWRDYEEMFPLPESSGVEIPPQVAVASWHDLYFSDELVRWILDRDDNPFGDGFRQILRIWQTRYKLSADWVVDAVVRTLHAWTQHLDGPGSRRWILRQPDTLRSLGASEMVFEFTEKDVWNPTLETREQASGRMTKAFKAALRTWFDEREQEIQERGFKKARPRPKAEEHLRWLVRFQCLGENLSVIARSEGRKGGHKTIENGVSTAAERIGIELRPGLKGRPPKRKSK